MADGAALPFGLVRVADRGDGTYEVTYVAPSAGALSIQLVFNGVSVPGSPFCGVLVLGRACRPN
jgi:hypothetical protein